MELTFWTTVKDSTNPAILNTYVQRFPNGQFVATARGLIERYEQQARAEKAARAEERNRLEEVEKAAKVTQLEEERETREALLPWGASAPKR